MSKRVFTQEDQSALATGDLAQLGVPGSISTYRKLSRIIAVPMAEPFIVYTDRGPMEGVPGDWLVTNHPDDDPESDIWTISAERMRNTYEQVG